MEDLTEIKVLLKSLIISHGHGMTLNKLERDYNSFNGTPIPYLKFGYRNLEKFLESIPDAVRLQRNSDDITVHSTFSKNTDHITQMIKSQKKLSLKTRRKTFRNSGTNLNNSECPKLCNAQTNFPFNSNNIYPGNITVPHNSIHIKNIPMSSRKNKHHVHHYIHYVPDNKSTATKENVKTNIQRDTQKFNKNSCFKVNVQRKENNFSIKPLTEKTNKENQISMLKEKSEYPKANINKEITHEMPNPLSEKEYEDLKEISMSRSFKDLNLNKLETSEATKSSYITEKPEVPNILSPKTNENLMENSTRIRMKTKICQYNKNLKQYHSNLNVISEKPIDINTISKNNELAIPHLNYKNDILLIDYPLPSSDICSSIPKIKLPNELKEGKQIILLFVTEIHNPFRFWFNIATNPLDHPLDILMADIENYYDALPQDELKFSRSHIFPGQACVALYHNLWHRAEILDSISYNEDYESYVKVFYVDYGTIDKCKLSNIRYLLKKFGELPRQAYRGTLSDIRPYIKWSRDATTFLIQKISDVPLQGKITYLEEDRKICHLRLLRPHSPQDELVYKNKPRLINELLETNGFAKRSPYYYNANSDLTIHERHYYHEQQKFPTFEILEMGKYPTYGQILIKLQTEKLDLEQKRFWLMQLENLNIPARYD